MKITNRDLVNLYLEEETKTEEGLTLVNVYEGEWQQAGKRQYLDLVFSVNGKNYRGSVCRAGSPFTDWEYLDYGDANIQEVEKREVTTTQWVVVK